MKLYRCGIEALYRCSVVTIMFRIICIENISSSIPNYVSNFCSDVARYHAIQKRYEPTTITVWQTFNYIFKQTSEFEKITKK